MHAWNIIGPDPATLPPIGEIVWLFERGRGAWIGNRYDDGEGWLWGNSHGAIWHNGKCWDADCEQDDDYHPTHWMRLPDMPNVEQSAEF